MSDRKKAGRRGGEERKGRERKREKKRKGGRKREGGKKGEREKESKDASVRIHMVANNNKTELKTCLNNKEAPPFAS